MFTNLDVTVTAFQRAVCLTSISAGPVHGDLAGRLLPVELDPIADDCRKEDAAIMAEFALYRPAILAGLFNVVAAVLSQLPRVRPDNLPRMADFGRHLAAIDVGMGWESLKAYRASVDDALRSVVADDPVAQAVVALVKAQPESASSPLPKSSPRTSLACLSRQRAQARAEVERYGHRPAPRPRRPRPPAERVARYRRAPRCGHETAGDRASLPMVLRSPSTATSAGGRSS